MDELMNRPNSGRLLSSMPCRPDVVSYNSAWRPEMIFAMDVLLQWEPGIETLWLLGGSL